METVEKLLYWIDFSIHPREYNIDEIVSRLVVLSKKEREKIRKELDRASALSYAIWKAENKIDNEKLGYNEDEE